MMQSKFIVTRLSMLVLAGMICISSLCMYTSVYGSCGLSHCTLVSQNTTVPSWQGFNLFRATDDVSGSMYLENFMGLGWKPISNLNVMALVPAVYIEGHSLGLGNSILQVDYQWTQRTKGIAVGVQGELPTSSESLYGDQHSVALPYVRGWWTQGMVSAQFQLGFAQTLDFGHHNHGTHHSTQDHGHHDHGHHDHGHHEEKSTASSVFMINPHSSSEVLLRAQLQWTPFPQKRWIELIVGMDGIQEVVDSKHTIVNALFGVQSTLSWSRLQALVLSPISENKHFENRFLLAINIPFGGASSPLTPTSPSSVLARY